MVSAKILVVEDEGIVALDLQSRLQDMGHEVVGIAASGVKAIETVGRTHPDLVLMDIVLKGGMDGVEAAEQIRTRYHIPVVYITAYADDDTLQRAKITGPEGYILKPIKERELQAAIQIGLYRHEAERKLRVSRDELEIKVVERTAELQKLLHELQVHRVELQAQNEQLRSTQAQLEESHRKYSDLYDFAPLGYLTLDVNGLIMEANLTAAKQLGMERDRLIQSLFPLCIVPADRETFGQFLTKIVAGKQGQSCEVILTTRKDGDGQFHARLDGLLVEDSSGSRLCRMAITNITAHKRAEEELLKVKKLEAIGILAGGIAHDFNNLLAVMMMNIEMAREDNEPHPSTLKVLDNAMAAVLRARDLVKKFLTFSAGGSPVKTTECVKKLIRDSAGLALSGSNLKCEYSFPDDLRQIEVDRSQISQAINNVIVNAREAMPRGGVIKISARNVIVTAETDEPGLPVKEGCYVSLSISDQGVGIPEESIDKIFDPYFSTKERGVEKGMGLGLSIALSAIKKHGGHIRVESEVGFGATFHILLPASPERVLEAPRPERQYVSTEMRKALLMDDEEAMRRMGRQVLQHLGFKEVELAEDGAKAIERFKKAKASGEPFDVVILDLTVEGGMGGEEAMRRLLEIDPFVKAIVSSGYHNDAVLSNYRDYGFSGALPKPYQLHELREILNKVAEGE